MRTLLFVHEAFIVGQTAQTFKSFYLFFTGRDGAIQRRHHIFGEGGLEKTPPVSQWSGGSCLYNSFDQPPKGYCMCIIFK